MTAGQGRQLARASLAVGYAIGIFGLLITVMSVFGAYIQEFPVITGRNEIQTDQWKHDR